MESPGARRWLRRHPWLAGSGAAVAMLLSLAVIVEQLVPALEYRPPERSVAVLDRQGKLLRLYTTTAGDWRLGVDSRRVDPAFVRELLAYEDKRFFDHPGVDPLALLRAIGQWIMAGRVISGASTLTMQTVRLLHPRPRTLLSKAIEMVQALRLERQLGKRGVLDLYLTLTPYGGNLQGIRAATRFYFNKEPWRLTPSERALLIALPQSPALRRPEKYPQRAREARAHVLHRLVASGLIGEEEARLARSRALPTQRLPAPMVAAHLADRLRRRHSGATQLQSTLDGTLQRALERQARAQQARLDPGVSLAALVINHRTWEVVGYLGSGDFLTIQLDLATAIRSPGSALKPFVYGLGFERGIIHPETRLFDRPRWVGSYGPRNFDTRYRGEISIRQALIRSLNTPAVRVMERVGPVRFHRRLQAVGVPLRLPEGAAPGLPTALGGAGISLEALTRLYAALANGGEMQRLRWLEGEPTRVVGRLISPAAAWYLGPILGATEPPPGMLRSRPIRFKTGTSYGFRDAWALGYAGDYTVGVWVGRPDGGSNAAATGLSEAAPLLFRIFALLPRGGSPPDPPRDVLQVTHAELPASLQWLDGESAGGDQASPRIRFPVDGSQLSMEGDALSLMVEGGRPPYFWLVDGHPHGGKVMRRHLPWSPEGSGRAELAVIDGAGRVDRVEVWVE